MRGDSGGVTQINMSEISENKRPKHEMNDLESRAESEVDSESEMGGQRKS